MKRSTLQVLGLRIGTAVLRTTAVAAMIAATLANSGGVALAHTLDEVAELNKRYASVKPELRTDLVLFPKLAKMQPPPRVVGTPQQAALIPTGSGGWRDAAAWAQGSAQQEVLAALRQVTSIQEWRNAYAIGLPYGAEGVPPELIQLEMYTDLGDPPTLAGARHLWMPALDDLGCLVNVEATRLAAEKKTGEAADLMITWAYFARQMCDRLFGKEQKWGFENFAAALERCRDILYLDLKNPSPSVTGEQVKAMLVRLDERDNARAYIDLNRIKFPEGDKAAVDQLIDRVYIPRGGVDERRFATTMARLGSSEFPLRLFSEAGKWQAVSGSQANQPDAFDRAKQVYEDWTTRWKLDPFDKQMDRPWEYPKLERARYGVVDAAMPDLTPMFSLRQIARVELVGTRTCLALVGVIVTRKEMPNVASAVCPQWLARLDADPFNPNRRAGALPPMEYFIPMRDTDPNDPRAVRRPHVMEIVPPAGGAGFTLSLDDSVFVLYSYGSDLAKNAARRIQNTAVVVQGADYIVWPPYLSLYRQHLIDLQQIK